MMDKKSVSRFSKDYENLFSKLIEKYEQERAFKIINDAVIISCVKNSFKFEDDSIENLYEKIVSRIQFRPFFILTKKSEYKSDVLNCVEIFDNSLKQYRYHFNEIEIVLSSVLEKHINKKKTGSYYTPNDTTEYIAWNSIILAIINKLNINQKKKILNKFNTENSLEIIQKNTNSFELFDILVEMFGVDIMFKKVYSLTIIDPMCGSGAFCLKAFDFIEKISKKYNKYNFTKIINLIYGLDISKEAIELTKMRFLLKMFSNESQCPDFNLIYYRNFINSDAFNGSDDYLYGEGFDWRSFGTKFDCIIGNPPYVEKKSDVYSNFETSSCGNLYALAIERAVNISNINSIISFIVPLSLIATPRMQPAKEYLEKKSSTVQYAMFADRPGCLFSGVHQRLVIFIADRSEFNNKIYSSGYNFWYQEERKRIFNELKYIENNSNGILVKYGNEIERDIYKKILRNSDCINNYIAKEKNEHLVVLSSRIGFWTKAFIEEIDTNELLHFYVENEKFRYFIANFLNSSLFYFIWIMQSDCWHVSLKDFNFITFDIEEYNKLDLNQLKNVYNELIIDLEKNKKVINSKQVQCEYKHKYSKSIIDKIDNMLYACFGLNETECDYIKKYTLKYRMNDAINEEN